jgi:hypothetical protein
MIGTINSWVNKVVGTVSGPLQSLGSKPKAVKKIAKCKKAKCKNKKCKC